MPANDPDVILLIGAGFSRPANVPLMSDFVALFEERMKAKGDEYLRYFTAIKEHITEAEPSPTVDLEKLMDVLYRLAGKDVLTLSVWREKDDIAAFTPEVRTNAKMELEALIREKCVIDPSTKLDDYLPLNEVIKAVKPLDIFSVNYDDVIEVFCYKHKYNLEDGFALYWDPSRFAERERTDVRLFKLHGSVLWFRTEEGAFYKLLLKSSSGCDELVTGERLQQLVAFPVAGKPIHAAPLAHAMNSLRERLEQVKLCIVIGYSMRDKHIQDIIIESLRRNDKLTIVIANIDPFAIRDGMRNEALKRATIPAAFGVTELINDGRLVRLSNLIKTARSKPWFEAVKNPIKAAEECFQALDYEQALRLVKEPSFWQSNSIQDLGNLEFQKALAGLSYAQMIGKFTSNPALEEEACDFIIEILRKTAAAIREPQDSPRLFTRSIEANEWVRANLQGKFRDEVEKVTKMRIALMKQAISKLKATNVVSEHAQIIERCATILFKWTTAPVFPYDDSDFSWIFAE